MYGNVLCAPNATRRPAIQRPATQQPANRRPATRRPTTSNSQPRVPRPEGGRRPETCANHVPTTGSTASTIKQTRQVREKSHVQTRVFRQLTEQLLPVNARPLLRPLCPPSFGSVGNQLASTTAPPSSMLRKKWNWDWQHYFHEKTFFSKTGWVTYVAQL